MLEDFNGIQKEDEILKTKYDNEFHHTQTLVYVSFGQANVYYFCMT